MQFFKVDRKLTKVKCNGDINYILDADMVRNLNNSERAP